MANCALPASLRLGDGPTAVFLLHGVGGAKEVWPTTMPMLAEAGFTAVAWDMPGYGSSDAIAPLTTASLAAALERLVDDVGAQRNILLGHSMGGMVAQEAMARFAHKVHGLVLYATSPAFGRPDGVWQQQFLQSRFAPLDGGGTMADLASSLVPPMMGATASPGSLGLAMAAMARVPQSSYRAALTAMVSFNRLDNLGRIQVPTLCLAGECDKNASPAVVLKMSQKISGAQYHCLGGAGHLANLEQPAVFNACLLAFLQQHFAPGETLHD